MDEDSGSLGGIHRSSLSFIRPLSTVRLLCFLLCFFVEVVVLELVDIWGEGGQRSHFSR
jgi:hypothetical protein